MSDFVCRDPECRSPHVRHAARGLCRTCFARHQRVPGELDRLFPKSARPVRPMQHRRSVAEVYDEKYERWIRKGNRRGFKIPAEQPTRWLRDLRDALGLRDASWGDGAVERLAAYVGLKREVVNNILSGNAVHLQDWVVERIALATNNIRAYYELRPPEGDPNWSDITASCFGCGTFHHPHHADGLCEECHTHRDDPDFETRDIRVTRRVRAEQIGGIEHELATAG